MPKKIFVVVSLQVEGIHRWSKCYIPDVMFLSHPHRHIFHIKAIKEVSHSDRDVEIIRLKRQILEYLNRSFYNHHVQCLLFDDLSCESIAELIMDTFELSSCEVLEDGENGAIITNYGS